MEIISLNLLPEPKYRVIGHRGALQYAPENTLASFKKAVELGINWIEFDVQLSKDDRLVIIHDHELERTTNGQGRVIDHTLQQLQALDAGSWFAPEFKNESIPTLEETLGCLLQWGVTPNIEIKCEKNQDPFISEKLAYRLAECLIAQWTPSRPLPLVTSFDHQAVLAYRKRINTLAPKEIPPFIGFVVDDILNEHIALIQNTPNSVLHCSQRYVSTQRIAELTAHNIPIFVYTVNNKAQGLAYLQAGAIAVFSDTPDIFLI